MPSSFVAPLIDYFNNATFGSYPPDDDDESSEDGMTTPLSSPPPTPPPPLLEADITNIMKKLNDLGKVIAVIVDELNALNESKASITADAQAKIVAFTEHIDKLTKDIDDLERFVGHGTDGRPFNFDDITDAPFKGKLKAAAGIMTGGRKRKRILLLKTGGF